MIFSEGIVAKGRRPRVNRHFRIDDELRPDDREGYLAFLREPGNTIDLSRDWLAEHGYRDVSRSAVARHRRHYLESFRRREELVDATRHYAHLAKAGGFDTDAIVAGLAARHETLLAEALFDQPHDEAVPLSVVNELGRLVSQMVTTRLQVTELERVREKAAPPTPAPSAEEEHDAAVRRVCEVLGVPYPEPGDN